MSKRNALAKLIQEGASNPIPISRALNEAIAECREEKVSPSEDPAVFMILHQLAYILGAGDIANTDQGIARYREAYDVIFPAEEVANAVR